MDFCSLDNGFKLAKVFMQDVKFVLKRCKAVRFELQCLSLKSDAVWFEKKYLLQISNNYLKVMFMVIKSKLFGFESNDNAVKV